MTIYQGFYYIKTAVRIAILPHCNTMCRIPDRIDGGRLAVPDKGHLLGILESTFINGMVVN